MASVPPGFPPPPPPFPPPPPPAGGRSGPPWEGSAPFVQRFIDTAQGLAMDPNAFFSAMRLEGGLVNPLIYAVVGAAGAGLVSALIGAVLPLVSAAFFLHLVIVPCLTAVMLFVGSGIYHVVLMLLGGAKQPFEATFRVVAYTMGTTTWSRSAEGSCRRSGPWCAWSSVFNARTTCRRARPWPPCSFRPWCACSRRSPLRSSRSAWPCLAARCLDSSDDRSLAQAHGS